VTFAIDQDGETVADDVDRYSELSGELWDARNPQQGMGVFSVDEKAGSLGAHGPPDAGWSVVFVLSMELDKITGQPAPLFGLLLGFVAARPCPPVSTSSA